MLADVTVDEIMAGVLALDGRDHVTNFYRDNGCCPLQTDTDFAPSERAERLRVHLALRHGVDTVIVGEAAGWRGARQTGLPFTSPNQIGGTTAEASATIVKAVLTDVGLVDGVLLWNACLLHPHKPSNPRSNIAPPRRALNECLELLEEVTRNKFVVAVGRSAERAVGKVLGSVVENVAAAAPAARAVGVRHPSYGGARQFRDGLIDVAARVYL